jgi:hypothetical protein
MLMAQAWPMIWRIVVSQRKTHCTAHLSLAAVACTAAQHMISSSASSSGRVSSSYVVELGTRHVHLAELHQQLPQKRLCITTSGYAPWPAPS